MKSRKHWKTWNKRRLKLMLSKPFWLVFWTFWNCSSLMCSIQARISWPVNMSWHNVMPWNPTIMWNKHRARKGMKNAPQSVQDYLKWPLFYCSVSSSTARHAVENDFLCSVTQRLFELWLATVNLDALCWCKKQKGNYNSYYHVCGYHLGWKMMKSRKVAAFPDWWRDQPKSSLRQHTLNPMPPLLLRCENWLDFHQQNKAHFRPCFFFAETYSSFFSPVILESLRDR